jgi:hypothetical protein
MIETVMPAATNPVSTAFELFAKFMMKLLTVLPPGSEGFFLL